MKPEQIQSPRDIDEALDELVPLPPEELPPIDSYPRNDAGTAQAFSERFEDSVRFAPGIGWLVWNGVRWQRDAKATVTQYAVELSRQAQREAASIDDEDKRKRATQHALSMGNRNKIDAVLALAESNPALVIEPTELDTDPFLFGVANGTIDLRNGTFHDSHSDELITLASPVPWEEGATCPTWERFLSDITRGDSKLIAFLWRAIGYSLTGDTREQRFFFLYGTGSNGKSVFVDTLKTLLGDYSHRASGELFERMPNRNKGPELAELPGKRIVLASETKEGCRMDEQIIKDITGGEAMRAEAKYQAGFPFTPSAKVWMSGNHKPVISGTDEGIWRRVLLVPFLARFEGAAKDPRMGEKLRAELPGILQWAVAGCLDWQRNGLPLPQVIRDAVNEYRSDEDTLGHFIAEKIEDAPHELTVSKVAVYNAYKDWAEDEGIRYPLMKKTLTSRLRERGWKHSKRSWHGKKLSGT